MRRPNAGTWRMTLLICDACKLTAVADEPPSASGDELAPGWIVRRIGGRDFTLCDCCGSIRQFKGGISAYLQKQLGVDPNAEIEFRDVPGGGLHRQRLRQSK